MISVEEILDSTMFDKPVGTPDKFKYVNIPEPADMVPPVNENPQAVVPPADTVNPALAATPPDAPVIVVPSILN